MTSCLRSLLSVGSTIGSLLEKLAKLSISNTNMSFSSHPATSHDEIKLKDNIRMEFFYRERARLRVYLIQVKLVYSLNLEKYSIEANKIIITITYLRGDTQF